MADAAAETGQRAVVVFDGAAFSLPYRLLRPGFRHCWVVLDEARGWTVLEARAGGLDIRALAGSDFDIAAFYRRQGYIVAEACVVRRGEGDRASTLRNFGHFGFPLMTCVEVVKRVLGVHPPLIVTPWQLYRYLEKNNATHT